MILTTDGRGEFILVAENDNRYEEFVTHKDAFTTLSSILPNDRNHETFDLYYTYDDLMESWPDGEGSRVLVKSQYVYGKERRIKDLKFDLENNIGPDVAIYPDEDSTEIRIRIRAITTEFDIETITWTWAYTQNNLGLSNDYADYLLTTGSGKMDASGLPSRADTPLTAWNALDAIYGFEFRIEPGGTEREWVQARWQAKLNWPAELVGYVILA